MKKYEILTNDFIKVSDNITLYRIKALKDFSNVKAGDLGGYIEREENLSQNGNCWVYNNGKVFNNAYVWGDTKIYDNAIVFEDAKIWDEAKIFGNTTVSGNAEIFGNTEVSASLICGDIRIGGRNNAIIYGR